MSTATNQNNPKEMRTLTVDLFKEYLSRPLSEVLADAGCSKTQLITIAKQLEVTDTEMIVRDGFCFVDSLMTPLKGRRRTNLGFRFALDKPNAPLEFGAGSSQVTKEPFLLFLALMHEQARSLYTVHEDSYIALIQKILLSKFESISDPITIKHFIIEPPPQIARPTNNKRNLLTPVSATSILTCHSHMDEPHSLFDWDEILNRGHRINPVQPFKVIFSNNLMFALDELNACLFGVLLPPKMHQLAASIQKIITHFEDMSWYEKNTGKELSILYLQSLELIKSHDPQLKDYIKLSWPEHTATNKYLGDTIALKEISLLSGKALNWQYCGDQTLRISHKKIDLTQLNDNCWQFDLKNQRLIFSGIDEVFEKALFQKPKRVNDESKELVYTLTNIHHINALSEAIIDSGATLKIDGVDRLTATDFLPTLSFDNANAQSMSIELNIRNGLSIPMLQSNILHSILFFLSAGLGQGLPYQGKLHATTRGDKRNNDLKLLKDEGIKRTLVSLSLNYLAENSTTFSLSEKNIKAAIKHIFEEFETNHQKLKSNSESFSKSHSPKIVKLVKHFIEIIIATTQDQKTKLIYEVEPGRMIYCAVEKESLILCEKLLALFSRTIGKEIFTRSRLKALTMQYTSSQILAPHISINTSLIDAAISHGFHLKIAGESISELDTSTLTAQIKVGDDGQKENWFSLHPEIFLDGQRVSEKDAKNIMAGGLIRYHGQMYLVDRKRLPAAKWLSYFWTRIKGQNKKSSGFGENENIVQLEPSRILNLLALKLAGMPVIGDKRWQAISKRFDQLLDEQNSEAAIDSKILSEIDQANIPLKPFQRHGTKWLLQLYELGLGGILADDMGLGKTIQTIALLSVLEKRRCLDSCLIVVPPTLLFNWQNELKRFAPNLKINMIASRKDLLAWQKTKSADSHSLTLTTYGLLAEHLHHFAQNPWNLAIFDEAQYLKNIKALRTGAARSLAANHKFCLSGTPLENHYGEYYSLIDLCVPGALGSYQEFMKTYVPARGSAQIVSRDDLEFLRLKTRPLILRRTKEKILTELPEKTETVITLAFESQQKKIYRNTAISWNKELQEIISQKGEDKAQIEMLTALLRLRQICSHPVCVPNTKYSKLPPKFERAISALGELTERGEAVVVFTTFRQTLSLLETALNQQGIFTLSISGLTPTKNRGKILEQFSKSQTGVVLLMTQKVGGVGLNLTRSSYVFHIEPWWNPQVENQATDRVHRIGQRRAVQVYRYVMENSVEERIQSLKTEKAKRFDALFSQAEDPDSLDSNSGKKSLSRSDFEYLIGSS